MPIYKMTFPAGSVTLGGNVEGGATGAGSNYYVFVLEQGTKSGPVSAPAAGTVIEDTWFNAGDSDGDGLPDAFEATLSLQLYNTDTDDDTIPDENEIGADGKTLFESATGLTFPPAAFTGGSEGTKGGCTPSSSSSSFVLVLGLWGVVSVLCSVFRRKRE